jgi:hypothetical protein
MSLIDKFLLALRQLGVNSKVAAGTRAGLGSLFDLIPGLEGAEHIARLTDMYMDQIIRVQQEIWRTPDRLKKVVSNVEEVIGKKELRLVKEPKVYKDLETVNKTLAGAEKVELPSVASSLPFKLHDVATGNAVTRRLPKSNMRPSSPIRSRANRYRG